MSLSCTLIETPIEQKIAEDLKFFRPNNQKSDNINVLFDEKTVTVAFRGLGVWHSEPNDENEIEEDDDFQVWNDGEQKKYMDIFTTFAKQRSWYYDVGLSLETGEKNYSYFTVKIKA
jgi:hypothetical protein